MSSPTQARKAGKLGVKGALAANFEAVFEALSMHVGTSDLVQSIRFRAARRFWSDRVDGCSGVAH